MEEEKGIDVEEILEPMQEEEPIVEPIMEEEV